MGTMNEVKITITGAGSTFGQITSLIKLLLESKGADIDLKIDHNSAIQPTDKIIQLKDRKIIIKTESLPWGG